MAMLTLDDDQVLALVRQLPKERKTWLLRALVSDQWPPWAELAEYAGQRVRAVAAARNQDWDRMSDEERDAFIDDIVHEECTIAAQVDAPLFYPRTGCPNRSNRKRKRTDRAWPVWI